MKLTCAEIMTNETQITSNTSKGIKTETFLLELENKRHENKYVIHELPRNEHVRGTNG